MAAGGYRGGADSCFSIARGACSSRDFWLDFLLDESRHSQPRAWGWRVNKAQEVGDWDVRGVDLDSVFASAVLTDTAMDAAIRTESEFSNSFPGWFLYRRVAAGVTLFDRVLEAWAVGCARHLARAEKVNGRAYIGEKTRGKAGWIAQAGRDGLDYAIYGRYPEGLVERAARFDVHPTTYQKIRDPIGTCMWIGLETFKSQLHANYWRVRYDEKRTG